MAFLCPMKDCGYSTNYYGMIMRHLEWEHSGEASFKPTCGLEGCLIKLKNMNSLRTHHHQKHLTFIRKHYRRRFSRPHSLNHGQGPSQSESESMVLEIDRHNSEDGLQIEAPHLLQNYSENEPLTEECVPVKSKLEMVRDMTLRHVEENNVCLTHAVSFNKSVADILNEVSLDVSQKMEADCIENYRGNLNPIKELAMAFSHMGSKYRISKDVASMKGYIEPIKIKEGQEDIVYIPIEKTLQLLLKQRKSSSAPSIRASEAD